MDKSQQKQFTGIWLPAHILDHEELSSSEKILWAQISALYKKEKGGCFASNEYLGEILQISQTQISRMLSKLKKLKLVKTVSFNGRERVIKSLYDQNGEKIG